MARTQVQSELLATNSISGTIIADNAITATHIATNAISGTLIQDSGIVTTMIAANNITATKVVTNAIQTRHIADDQVTEDKLANAINTSIAAKLPLAGGTMTGNLLFNDGVSIRNTSGNNLEIGAMLGDGSNTIIKSAGDTIFQYYNGSAWVENVRFDDGKVGIGDTSPFAKLHVEDTGWSSGAPYGAVAYIQGGGVNDLNWGHLLISQSGTTTDTGGRLAFGANGENPIAGIRAKYKGATYGDLAFLTRPSGGTNTERMVIDSSGKVGINKTDPAAYLDVHAPSGVSGPVLSYFKSDQHGLGIYMNVESTYSEIRSNNNSYPLVLNKASGGNVGIGSATPTKGKLQIDGGSSGSGDFDALAIKHVNTTTTGDGPVMRFEGSYNSADWALAEMKATNGGAGHGANFQIRTHPGTGTQSSAVVPTFSLDKTAGGIVRQRLNAQTFTLAANAQKTFTDYINTTGIVNIASQRNGSNSIIYTGGLFYLVYSSAVITEIADVNDLFLTSDTSSGAGKICIYKGNASATFYIVNRTSHTMTLSVHIVEFQGN